MLPLLGVIAAEGIRAHPEGVVPVGGALLTFVHALPALMWAGMLLYTLRAAVAWRHDPVALRGLVRLYANAAAWLFAFVVLTGVIIVVVLIPVHSLVHSLLTTGFGIAVLVKAALVLTVAVLAILGRAWLGLPRPAAGPARATWRECGALAAVLAITGALTVLTPPAASARPRPRPGPGTLRSRLPARAVPRRKPRRPGHPAGPRPAGQACPAGTRTARAQPGASGAASPSRAMTHPDSPRRPGWPGREPIGQDYGHRGPRVQRRCGGDPGAHVRAAPADQLHLPGRADPAGGAGRGVTGEHTHLAGQPQRPEQALHLGQRDRQQVLGHAARGVADHRDLGHRPAQRGQHHVAGH